MDLIMLEKSDLIKNAKLISKQSGIQSLRSTFNLKPFVYAPAAEA